MNQQAYLPVTHMSKNLLPSALAMILSSSVIQLPRSAVFFFGGQDWSSGKAHTGASSSLNCTSLNSFRSSVNPS